MMLNVFLDTSIFVKYHFIFEKYKLKKISELAEAGLIQLVTTDIIKHEIIKNLKEETAKTRKAINAMFDDGQFLHTFSEYQAIEEFLKTLKPTAVP